LQHQYLFTSTFALNLTVVIEHAFCSRRGMIFYRCLVKPTELDLETRASKLLLVCYIVKAYRGLKSQNTAGVYQCMQLSSLFSGPH